MKSNQPIVILQYRQFDFQLTTVKVFGFIDLVPVHGRGVEHLVAQESVFSIEI